MVVGEEGRLDWLRIKNILWFSVSHFDHFHIDAAFTAFIRDTGFIREGITIASGTQTASITVATVVLALGSLERGPHKAKKSLLILTTAE